MHPGTIGPYRVERELGRGGMGHVLLARDPRLDRLVAIKALPPNLAADPDRLARFQREAKVLASLNHPNISAIYGVEELNGSHYLILEFVEGQTLEKRMASGPIAVMDAMGIARQIAEGLETAHERGIVHRDLKPGNVIVTPEGIAKVLDFGLARATVPDAAGAAGSGAGSGARPGGTSGAGTGGLDARDIEGSARGDSPTISLPPWSDSPTMPGVIMGSAGYMSPEQARGRVVDKRSDIFSFGCVLFEMLSGSKAFDGESAAECIAAVLHLEPDLSRLPASTPTRLRDLVASCLAKDPTKRLRDIGDARIAIDELLAGGSAATSIGSVAAGWNPHESTGRRHSLAVALAFVVAGVAVAFAASLWMRWPNAETPAQVRLVIPSASDDYRWATSAAISPDGARIVFEARPASGGPSSLWMRPLDSFKATMIPGTANATSAFWSWDSRSIAFHMDGKLWSVDADRLGSQRLLAAVADNGGAAWGPTGEIVLAAEGGENAGRLLRIPAGGGEPVVLLAPDPGAFEAALLFPHFLPDGERFLFVGVRFDPSEEVRSAKLFMGRLGSSERTLIGKVSSGVWFVDPGWLVFVDDGTIKRVSFDPVTLRTSGEPITIAEGAFYFRPLGMALMSVSRKGTIVFDAAPIDDELVWYDLDGQRGRAIAATGRFQSPRISPDGSQVVVAVSDRRTQLSDLWLYGVERPVASRLTTDARWESIPVWSHDGRSVFFSCDRRSTPEIFCLRTESPGDPTPVKGLEGNGLVWAAHDTSRDGRFLLASADFERHGREFRVLALDGSATAVPFQSSHADEVAGRFSPDGRWIALQVIESGSSQIFMAPFPGPGSKVLVAERGSSPVWSPKGDAIYFRQRSESPLSSTGATQSWRIMKVPLDRSEDFKSPPAPQLVFEIPHQIGDLDITPDGRRLLLRLVADDTPPIQVILHAIQREFTTR